MKRLSFFLISTALLVSGASAFAFGRGPSNYENSAASIAPADMSPTTQSVQQWVGKPADELVKTLGDPDYTSTTTDGSKVYVYLRIDPAHAQSAANVARQFQFVVGSDGDISSAKVSNS
jgi:hypothetical protein